MPPAGKSFVHITGMVQDKQGYMWFASKNGLFRYDGYQLKQYRNNPLDENSISSDALECICVDKNGILWIGTFNSGLDRFDPSNESFKHFKHDANDEGSISSDTVSVVFSDKNGTLWLGANCLEEFNPGTDKFIHYRNKPGDHTSISCNDVRTIYEDHAGTLWIGTGSVYNKTEGADEGGLNKMDRLRSSFTRYMHDPNDPNTLINNKVRAIFEDSKGNFWIGTSGDGLHTMNRATGKFERHLYDPDHPEKLSRPAFKPAPYYDHITFITEDVTGAIWIGTSESGINYYEPVTKRMIHFEDALGLDTAGAYMDYTAWWAYTSRDGILWISSLGGSLYRVNPSRVSVPFYRVPGPARGATSFVTDNSNVLWVATNGAGIITKDAEGKVIKNYKHDPADDNGIGSNEIECMSSDSEGNIWMGVSGKGLMKFDRKSDAFINYKYDTSRNRQQEDHEVLCIYPGSPGILWIGTARGLNRFNERTGESRHYSFYPNDQSEFGADVITSILRDSRSVWWTSSWQRGGVKQFDPETGKFKTYLKAANLVKIYEDHEQVLWAAGLEGLFRFNREKDAFVRFDDLGFLSEGNKISNLVEDNKGNLWLTTSSGIVRVNPQRDESTLFGKSYGINGNDFYFLSGYKNKQGKLFFGGQSGYYSFFPDEITQKKRAPEITITAFKISNIAIQPGSDDPLSSMKEIILNHNQNTFSFEFVGIDYSNPEDNRHLFMLENYDAGWNLAGSERNASYFNVPPGKYVFRVKVVNSYGVWAERDITVMITPPWWSTWWFRLGSLLLIASSFYAVIRWRIRRKFDRQIEQSEKDKQLAELKQKTGELEMQALRAQMNPHFVFNSLNAINRFILENNKTQASGYLTKFSRLVRMILQNSQSTLITLESELESLKLYLELEALRFEGRFEYQVTVSKDLDIDILKVPPLIIQPYAENAIWHGLMHKEEKGHLTIDISQQDDYLVFRIKDDGIGRKQSAAIASKSATKHKSMGLQITADRIAMLHRSASKDSPVVINDLENADGSAAGTEVIIKTPFIYG